MIIVCVLKCMYMKLFLIEYIFPCLISIFPGPDTNRSQFFICYERQPHLNNLHTVFGRMLDGWDVLDKMEALPVLGPAAPKKKLEHRPVDPPVIQKITVHANPLADEMIVFPTPTAPPEKRV